MAGIARKRLGWRIRLGLAGCAVALLAVNWAVRRSPTATVSSDRPVACFPFAAQTTFPVSEHDRQVAMTLAIGEFMADAREALPPIWVETRLSHTPDAGELLLVNEDWHIRNMATAQGAFVTDVDSQHIDVGVTATDISSSPMAIPRTYRHRGAYRCEAHGNLRVECRNPTDNAFSCALPP